MNPTTSKCILGTPRYWSLWFHKYHHSVFDIDVDMIIGYIAIDIWKWGLELNWPCDCD